MVEQRAEAQGQKKEDLTRGFGYQEKTGHKEYGKITEEAVQALRARIGVERVNPVPDWAVQDSRYIRARIREIACAVGDYNPLYLDLDYAKRSPYGTIIAPPASLVGIEQVNAATDGMPGLHALFRGLTLEWRRPIRMGDILTGKTYLRDVRVVDSKLSRRAVIQEYESIGTDEKGDIIGREWTSWHRLERAASKEEGKYEKVRGLAQYTPEDLKRIRGEQEQEFRRGAEPLTWEDVNAGEEITPVVKGPTNQAQRFIGEAGTGGGAGQAARIGSGSDWGQFHAQLWNLFEKHPALPFVDEQGIPQVPVVIHNNNYRAQRYLGLPGAYDAGWQRLHWTCHSLMNWMGDHGFLRKLTIKFPMVNILGDTTWCKGRVTAKRIDGDKHVVELEVTNVNQLGHVVTAGTAEVVLPTRSNPKQKLWDG